MTIPKLFLGGDTVNVALRIPSVSGQSSMGRGIRVMTSVVLTRAIEVTSESHRIVHSGGGNPFFAKKVAIFPPLPLDPKLVASQG